MAARPSMFVGSSVEGLRLAQALQAELEHDVDATIWSQGVFGLSEGGLEALESRARTFDFAALVLTPDDLRMKHGQSGNTPRDNVLFEAGLFMGALGRRRVFLVSCRDDVLDLPTDLAGITQAQFNRRNDGNLRAAVGPVATNLRVAIDSMGHETGGSHAEPPEVNPQSIGGDATDVKAPDDLAPLVRAVDQLAEQLEPDESYRYVSPTHAEVYRTILSKVKIIRPDDIFVSALPTPVETLSNVTTNITAAEVRSGLAVIRSALLSAP